MNYNHCLYFSFVCVSVLCEDYYFPVLTGNGTTVAADTWGMSILYQVDECRDSSPEIFAI